MNKLIKINPLDNVFAICNGILPGDEQEIDGVLVVFDKPLGLGHKIAARPILKGEQVIKFGVPIGSAIEDIPRGAHVHLHNLKSDYISTYTLDHEFISPK
ncbi:D-galactarate dehydratase/Altronate hydrolase-like protein [Arcticibacter svalbardensis MN12-7]|uniref:D-galactarate dehydratase/Altronate hydrolase-like protein n=1 Tax=Arcticibacter svalbardensis MN12-7 TaxID=1150600 RepID=R9H6J3_9SPHI|nr:UxaA family hydrolase [Arcticibacter svalbardensis]EOR96789.1 D-galactarate dehydratase/Altronate hydrolase-like protein [Arcticibacter svalbardensis MN12-7]